MSGGGQTPAVTTTTTNATPWAGAQPHLLDVMAQGQAKYGQDVGYQPWTGATQAPKDPALSLGLIHASSIAQQNAQGSPAVMGGLDLAQKIMANQGITPGQQSAIGGLGTAAGQYGSIYSDASSQQNPYLLAQIAANDRRIADKVNSSMSGSGRYGSGAHTDVLSRALAEAANPIFAQDYARRQQERLAATQGLTGTQGMISDIYAKGLNQAGQFAQLVPGLEEARYAPANQLMNLGAYETGRAQNDLASQINLWNAQQARPWEQLARYSGIVGGMGGLGGTKITSAPNPNAPVSGTQRLLGGALAGGGIGSAFGPVGAGVGALGGGLLGLL